jgi:hypothetical protein
LAIIANGGRAIVVIYTEGEDRLILIKPFDGGLAQSLVKRLPGVGYVLPSKPCAGGGNGSIMVGMFV